MKLERSLKGLKSLNTSLNVSAYSIRSRRCFFVFVILVFISLCEKANAQSNYRGRVIDSLTKEPVSYATVSATSISMYCDSLGFFEIKNLLDEDVFISCVGYKAKRVRIRKGDCDTLYLSPTYKQLEPLSVGQYPWLKNPSLQIGKIEGKSKFAVNVPSGFTFLKYFAKPKLS